MARLKTNGMAEFSLALEEIIGMPDEVIFGMLEAAGDVVEVAQKGMGMAYKVYDTGALSPGVTLESIKKGRPGRTNDGAKIVVAPRGTNSDGNRNAEVAFINEYGKTGQPARPFIRDANEACADEANEAAAGVYDAWLASKNL